ncbi:alpha/beta hydrolase [Lutimaribacter sp. EGI FJ00015]|uniref:Alpha/beta hydrolase n=1 Tax=Lutimaribacter degradans TaxID=2945989 RepID=A0ACC6A2T2_9RHOB|nr:alpha/beta hydrolase [Lutimaribacter sp. EGI FJ00013]MCM2563894.1 alpha/beta hydrolase [Lutimaribacter sp. EGI FJ00013]MCO0614053.1 alpha/beta hydrolase [Lutimaribacter sp. EGI FJ00015]MCO0636199.1 alpha/beta hydrolase [Lutimaribacter sp. EGI FJ00014]
MSDFTTSDGLRLHYEDEGTGLPLLCLPGLTRNARDFDFVAPHLGHARLIRMDYRGRGQSEWADPATYTVPQEARDALELLDHLGIEKAAVLGTSRGGIIAMMLAATAHDRLLGVALNDIGPVVEPAGLDAIMDYLGREPGFDDFDQMARARQQATAATFPDVPLARWRQEVTHTHVETPKGLRINYDPNLRRAVEAAAAKGTPDLWPLFEAIAPLPAAVIHGVNSDILSTATVDEMARRHPGLVVARVPNRAHIPFLDEKPALEALQAWIAKMQ